MPSDNEKRTLSKRERDALEFEERQAAALKEREDHKHFQDEVRAVNLGLPTTLTGRRIERQVRGGATPAELKKREEQRAIIHLFTRNAALGDIIVGMEKLFYEAGSSLRKSFKEPAKDAPLADDNNRYIFDDTPMRVTFATQAAIEQDAATITAEVKKLDAMLSGEKASVPGDRARQAMRVLNLAEEFDMRRHPETKQFIPSLARVEELEQIHNPHGRLPCDGLVCVFRIKSEAASDRAIKRTIADPTNQSEVKITAAEIREAEAARPVPPPNAHKPAGP
ncbi:MAG: hypothetical protein WC989_00155 [Micavibrio sp.]